MQPPASLFETKTDSFWRIMNSHNGIAGFRVPEYQRIYNWEPGRQINRLLEDCLNGFFYFSNSSSNSVGKYTFLATIILVKEEQHRDLFTGKSLSIVDGQQRLTTLVLTCCALIEELLCFDINKLGLKRATTQWIEQEVGFVCEQLFSCVVGQFHERDKTFPFPRVVRTEKDYRAKAVIDSEYHSIVASFLMKFSEFYRESEPLAFKRKNGQEEKLFFQNYYYVKEQVRGIHKDDGEPNVKRDIEYEPVSRESFSRNPLRHLFKKINVLPDRDQDRAYSDIVQNSNSSGLIRLLLFSHYLMDRVILTRVETSDEASAFDIFDALNTTGEPLTALETFKPLVVHFEEKEADGYKDSPSDVSFRNIENLNVYEGHPEKRQNVTKDLLVTFALYLEGHKLLRELGPQRIYLRNIFNRIPLQKRTKREVVELKRKIVESLEYVAEFRHEHWNSEFISYISASDSERNDTLKLCLSLMSDMNTSMTLPILTRYWVEFKKENSIDSDTFIDVVKAVTAFLVLRRSVTGGTSGIDADFKNIVKEENDNISICVGLDHSKSSPSLSDLKETLRRYLDKRRDIRDKKTWVEKASTVGLANRSIPLCRFLLFAASHEAEMDKKNLGLLTREGVIRSDIHKFLSFENWRSENEKYATVEHVAPQSQAGAGWDKAIYQNQYILDTIGNLVLLPRRENSIISDNSWQKKKLFYAALSSNSRKERDDFLDKAKGNGFHLSGVSEELIRSQDRLYMLSPLTEVKKWDLSFIKRRTRNILGLVWDEIAPWLSY